VKDWAAVRIVGPGAPCGLKGTMYEVREGDIVEYELRGGEERKQLLVRV
jgi:hypothetical protein